MRTVRTSADTWDEEPIDRETFEMLFDLLSIHPDYTLRPVIQVSHDDSAVVKTIETLDSAEETLSNLKFDIMAGEGPFGELTDEQQEVLDEYGIEQDELLMDERGNNE